MGPKRGKKKTFSIRRSLILRITPGSLTHAPQSHFSPPGFAHRCTRRELGRTFYLVNLGTPGAPPTWKHFSLLASPPFHLARPAAGLLACLLCGDRLEPNRLVPPSCGPLDPTTLFIPSPLGIVFRTCDGLGHDIAGQGKEQTAFLQSREADHDRRACPPRVIAPAHLGRLPVRASLHVYRVVGSTV